MPILIKGSGGVQEAPVISVSSSGLITATAGDEKTTKQLSSAYDADFVAGNIKSGVNIFGVTGTMEATGGAATTSAYGDGSNSIQFSFSDFPSVEKIISLALFYYQKSVFGMDDNMITNGYTNAYNPNLNLNIMYIHTAMGSSKYASVSYGGNSVTITSEESDYTFKTDGRYLLMVSYMDDGSSDSSGGIW